MSCNSIQGLATGGLLLAATLAVAAPAEGGVTAIETKGSLTVSVASSPTNVFSFNATEVGEGVIDGDGGLGGWGSFSISSTGPSFVASATTSGIGDEAASFDMQAGLIFGALTETRLSISYDSIEGSTGALAALYLFNLSTGEPVDENDPIWVLDAPTVNGAWTVDVQASAPGFAYLIGYGDTWDTPSGSTSSGGLSVTFTEIPAPGAFAGLGAMGLLGACGRRRRG